jgi:hypothetical protein
MSKLPEKPSALKREHPAIQKINFVNFFLWLGIIFGLLDPDPDCESGYGSGSTALLKMMGEVHGRARAAKTHWFFLYLISCTFLGA